MIDLIKKLIDRRRENVTFVLLDEKGTDPQTFSLHPFSFFGMLTGLNFGVIFIIAAFLYITPVGNMIFNKTDREVRESIVDITQKVMMLQDSLNARDQQLHDIRTVLAEGSDTIFSVRPVEYREDFHESTTQTISMEPPPGFPQLDANQTVYSRNLRSQPEFPAEPPLSGTVTRTFDKDRIHLGIDIAASEGANARVIADGVISNADWTMNYGYVVHVHHGNGYMSTYKHLSNIYKKKGDIIFKGDILGTVGKSGVLTSGPHIHFELWRDGIALDPFTYLTNLTEVN